MKKKGLTFIEVIVAMTIFLIGILPVSQLTLNSLKSLKRASEIQDGVKVTTTVVNYIKSRGYNRILADVLEDDDDFSAVYYIKYDDIEKAYVIDTNEGEDFELDFFGEEFYDESNTDADALFVIDSLGIDLEGATIDVVMKKTDVILTWDGSDEDDYLNPITNEKTNIIYGKSGLNDNDDSDATTPEIDDEQIIFGRVTLNYTSKSRPDEEVLGKSAGQNFIVVPIENFD